jgi:hypothetical protein
MPDPTHMLAFLLAALLLAATPGRGMLYVLARSLGGADGGGDSGTSRAASASTPLARSARKCGAATIAMFTD